MSDKKQKYTQNLDDQVYSEGKKSWRISRLLKLVEDMESFEIPLKHLNIYNLYPKIESTNDFINHVKRVNLADLKCPIILDEEGYVMDGRHRIAKAILKRKKKILAVRFNETPPCCYIDK